LQKGIYNTEKLVANGNYMTYEVYGNAEVVDPENMLPMGVAETCIFTRNFDKDKY